MISAKPVAMVAMLSLAHLAVPVPLPAQGVTVKATALTELSVRADYPYNPVK